MVRGYVKRCFHERCTIISEDGKEIQSNGNYREGTIVEINDKDISVISDNQEDVLRFLNKLEENISLEGKGLFPAMEKAAKKIKASALIGRAAIVRFHNDADGIIGGIAISSVLPAFKQPQPSATYTERDAINDIGNSRLSFMPLAVFIDFGSSEESGSNYDILKAAGFEIIVIDHHPYDDNVAEKVLMVNSLKEGLPTDYTAGYLSVQIAKLLGKDLTDLGEIALAGDKSSLGYSEDAEKTALALDYAAFYSHYGSAFNIYRDVLKDKELRDALYRKAKEALEETKRHLKRIVKTKKVGEFTLYYFDAEAIGSKGEFPGSGKMATLLAEELKGENAIILATTGKMLSFRLSKKGSVDLSKLVDVLVEKVSFIVNGGGHANAASFRIKDPSYKDVAVEAVITELEEFLKKVDG